MEGLSLKVTLLSRRYASWAYKTPYDQFRTFLFTCRKDTAQAMAPLAALPAFKNEVY